METILKESDYLDEESKKLIQQLNKNDERYHAYLQSFGMSEEEFHIFFNEKYPEGACEAKEIFDAKMKEFQIGPSELGLHQKSRLSSKVNLSRKVNRYKKRV